jgi:hypothetical protein
MAVRSWFRMVAAVAIATFAAGAAVSLRLHMRLPGPLDWGAIASQGLEVAAWFSLFASAAVWTVTMLARSKTAFPGRRLLLGVAAYALALLGFVLVFIVADPGVGADGLVNLYLAVGSFAGVMAAPSPPGPRTTAASVAHAA